MKRNTILLAFFVFSLVIFLKFRGDEVNQDVPSVKNSVGNHAVVQIIGDHDVVPVGNLGSKALKPEQTNSNSVVQDTGLLRNSISASKSKEGGDLPKGSATSDAMVVSEEPMPPEAMMIYEEPMPPSAMVIDEEPMPPSAMVIDEEPMPPSAMVIDEEPMPVGK